MIQKEMAQQCYRYHTYLNLRKTLIIGSSCFCWFVLVLFEFHFNSLLWGKIIGKELCFSLPWVLFHLLNPSWLTCLPVTATRWTHKWTNSLNIYIYIYISHMVSWQDMRLNSWTCILRRMSGNYVDWFY